MEHLYKNYLYINNAYIKCPFYFISLYIYIYIYMYTYSLNCNN